MERTMVSLFLKYLRSTLFTATNIYFLAKTALVKSHKRNRILSRL